MIIEVQLKIFQNTFSCVQNYILHVWDRLKFLLNSGKRKMQITKKVFTWFINGLLLLMFEYFVGEIFDIFPELPHLKKIITFFILWILEVVKNN